MNKKGFTLVELLVVIVILGSIASIAVLGIRNSLKNRDTREVDEQRELAKSAAKIYFSLNDGTTRVSVSILKQLGYFNATSKTDKLGDSDCVRLIDSGEYKYDVGCNGEPYY